MIKSNTKAAQRRIVAHVLSWFVDAETKAEKLEALHSQVQSLMKNGPAAYCPTYYAAGLKMAEGGCGACYIGDARREIAAIMEGRRESVLCEID